MSSLAGVNTMLQNKPVDIKPKLNMPEGQKQTFHTLLAGMQQSETVPSVSRADAEAGSGKLSNDAAIQFMENMVFSQLTGSEQTKTYSFSTLIMEKINVIPLNKENIEQIQKLVSDISGKAALFPNDSLIDSLSKETVTRIQDVSDITNKEQMLPVFLTVLQLLNGLSGLSPEFSRQLEKLRSQTTKISWPTTEETNAFLRDLAAKFSTANLQQNTLTKPALTAAVFEAVRREEPGTPFVFKRAGMPAMDNTAPPSEPGIKTTLSESASPPIGLPMSKVEQYILHIGEAGKKPDIEKLMQDFQQILARSSITASQHQTKLMIKLYPEHLGSLQIELLKTEQGMLAKIVAATPQAKELLESQISSLKQAFTNQQINVEKIDVQQQFQLFEKSVNHSFNQQPNDEQGRQKEQQQQALEEKDETSEFSTTFEEALINFNV